MPISWHSSTQLALFFAARQSGSADHAEQDLLAHSQDEPLRCLLDWVLEPSMSPRLPLHQRSSEFVQAMQFRFAAAYIRLVDRLEYPTDGPFQAERPCYSAARNFLRGTGCFLALSAGAGREKRERIA
jgi:hypothetical protein